MPLPKCGICLSYTSSTDGDYFCNTLCGHLYHFYCIKEWIDRHPANAPEKPSCPECRGTLDKRNLIKLHGISPVLQVGVEGNEVKYNIKVTILGNSSVGKSSMLHSFTHGYFDDASPPTRGVDMGFKTMDFAGKRIKLTVWDCAGQDRFRAICPSYIRNSHGIILVYDIRNPTSLKDIEEWLQLVYQTAPPDVSIILVGNKCDLEDERKVSTEEGQTVALHMGFDFIETSAKDVINIEAAFRLLLAKIISSLWDEGYIDSFEMRPTTIKLSNEAPIPPERQSCARC